ncbi:MAG TPA: flagellar basal body-associated FliL family protein [Opitutaceae bacterium]|nr:flagellar basal body-associated FliL family protein [Opitutaceae bacterium]
MAAKTEAPPAAAAPAAGGDAEAPAKKSGLMSSLIPIVAVVVLAPVGSWAVAQFVIIPQLRKELTTASAPKEGEAHGEAAAEHAPAHGKEEKKEGGHGKKEASGAAGSTYTFENIVVNLAGTMGTRYLKATFMVSGTDATLRAQFEANKPKLLDVSLNVLSALTLTDLEEPGSKNIIREKLASAYNQALGKKVAEQIYFSDFVVQ